jgi:hypothetical protein
MYILAVLGFLLLVYLPIAWIMHTTPHKSIQPQPTGQASLWQPNTCTAASAIRDGLLKSRLTRDGWTYF